MSESEFSWLCPSCHHALLKSEKVWRCENGHQFDSAREGYVNLLLAQHKNSKQPGDNKAMVAARRTFLNSGHYAPLAEKMADMLLLHAERDKGKADVVSLFDAGCGEGYYLNAIYHRMRESGVSVRASGIDISKFAIQKAAKQYKDGHFAVASTFAIPAHSDSQDAVIQVFAPSSEVEIARVLKKGGYWLKVSPGANHLHQLKALVYDNPEQHEVSDKVPAEFELVDTASLRFEVVLADAANRESLLMMTPFYWQISEQKKLALLSQLVQVEANFHIALFRATKKA